MQEEGSDVSERERVELKTIVRASLRRWWLVVPLALLAAGGAYAVSLSIAPVYRASTSVLVGGALDDPNVSPDDIDSAEHQTLTYADMVGRQPVLQGVVDSLGLRTTWQQLRSRVHGELVPGNTELIVINADGPSTEEATEIAAAAATQLVAISPTEDANHQFVLDQLDRLIRNIEVKQRRVDALQKRLAAATSSAAGASLRRQISEAEDDIAGWQEIYATLSERNTGGSVNQLEIIEQAQASSTPVIPNTQFNVLIAVLLGLLLGAAIAYALEFRTRERAREALGLSRARAPQNGHGRSADGERSEQEEISLGQPSERVVGSSHPEAG
jgi:capsular polysaccharide biosynthesis protein